MEKNELSGWVEADPAPIHHWLEEYAVANIPDHLKFQLDVTPEDRTDES